MFLNETGSFNFAIDVYSDCHHENSKKQVEEFIDFKINQSRDVSNSNKAPRTSVEAEVECHEKM